MAKDRKIKLTIDCEIDTSFWSYGSKKLDDKAIASIKRDIKDKFDCSCFELRVEKDEESDYYDDATTISKCRVKGHRIYSKK